MLPSGFRLLPVAPIECYERSAQGIVISSIFAAVETNPADKFSIGALGQWLPLPELLQKVAIYCLPDMALTCVFCLHVISLVTEGHLPRHV